MKTVYIGFSKPVKFAPFAWIIQKIESRDYDHVYIRFPEPVSGEHMIFQASKSMVNLYSLSIFAGTNVAIKEYAIDITDEQYGKLWSFVLANLGIPYSLLEDFGILLMKVFKVKQPFNSGLAAEFCSKLGANVCILLGIPISENPGAIDPSLLDLILSRTSLAVTLNPVIEEHGI